VPPEAVPIVEKLAWHAEVALECDKIYESGHAFDIWTDSRLLPQAFALPDRFFKPGIQTRRLSPFPGLVRIYFQPAHASLPWGGAIGSICNTLLEGLKRP